LKYNLITILGPTASGKTALAAHVAFKLGSSVISADSRQVYRYMDIGTGKDFGEYLVEGQLVKSYLVNICNPGDKYNLYEFQKDFFDVFKLISSDKQVPVLCGGSGLYIESVLKSYRMLKVPINLPLRKELINKSDKELSELLYNYRKLHNTTDTITRKRLIRAIEIEMYHKGNPEEPTDYPEINSLIVGIKHERELQKQRITERLKTRLKNGLIEEVKQLLDQGIFPEDLIYYGLEYKFVTLYLIEQLTYDEMFNQLNIAIHQFSKRQMTWFRKMEREGFRINWIDGILQLEEKVERVFNLMNDNKGMVIK
jgi:tRNA dimethylallyltransferase